MYTFPSAPCVAMASEQRCPLHFQIVSAICWPYFLGVLIYFSVCVYTKQIVWPRVIRLSITVQLNGCILLRWINYNRATEDPLICSGYGWIVTCQNITKEGKLGTMYTLHNNIFVLLLVVMVVVYVMYVLRMAVTGSTHRLAGCNQQKV